VLRAGRSRVASSASGMWSDLRRRATDDPPSRPHPCSSRVYVEHTGPLSWVQRAWVGELTCWPGALSHGSVWRETPLIHVAVGHDRRLVRPAGMVVHRTRHFESRVNWRRSPPRVLIEDAALDVASNAGDDFEAIATLAEVVQSRLTTYDALAGALHARARLARGRWLNTVLTDLALGANSVLEHEYLVRVERAHGLPPADRQVVSAAGARRVERDVMYRQYGLVVELVGRVFHDSARAWSLDLDRDLAAASDEDLRTVRLGWAQVVRDHCRSAGRLGVLLQRGGWKGSPTPCPACR
jgi:hypothetical protein